MTATLPVLFVSHGAPTFALEPGLAGPQLTAVGKQLPAVQAVLIVSPHWETSNEIHVSVTERPETIHDFGGFSPALYALRYPVDGHPALSKRAADLLRGVGFPIKLDAQRGLDHGAWVPLLHLFPEAQVPVFQVSLPYPLDPIQAVSIGRALSPLRDQGVLIVGSGSLTHNLREFRKHDSGEETYVHEFVRWVRDVVMRDDIAQLIDYRRLAPHAERAHPSDDHFLPLLVAMGALRKSESVEVIEGGVAHGVLSMESYVLGRFGKVASASHDAAVPEAL